MNGLSPDITIRINNLGIGYPSALGGKPFTRDGICFTGCRGEVIALIGLNGIGKSTLLRTIAGLQKKLSGEIILGNRPVDRFHAGELARLISFVSTENIRIPHMRVSDLVAFGRFPYTGWLGTLQSADHEMIRRAIEKSGLLHLSDKLLVELSDGERQRAMIARALAQDTPLIILDEPTAFLDISNKYSIFGLLREAAHQHQKTVILSTHDLHIALREADKLWIMLQNETREGAPEDAALNGWLSRLFPDERIGYDTLEGDFFFRKKSVGKVAVKGTGLPYTLMVKALERKGYEVVTEGMTECTISVHPGSRPGRLTLELTRGSSAARFSTIYDLLTGL